MTADSLGCAHLRTQALQSSNNALISVTFGGRHCQEDIDARQFTLQGRRPYSRRAGQR
jgi:hypothetical protein